MHARDAWRRHYATQPAPWRGPVHAAPLIAQLSGRIVELGASGGKVGTVLPPDTLALDWAREGLPAGRPAVVADVVRLPLRAASVDALVAIHVLGHLTETSRHDAVAECARVLRPGGRLVFEAFAEGDAREGTGERVEPGTWVRGGIATHHFSVDEVRALFAGWSGDVALETRRAKWGERRVIRALFTAR